MYKKEIETKIIRTRHIVTFKLGSYVSLIMQDMKNVPSAAKLVDYDDEDEEKILTFEIEHTEK